MTEIARLGCVVPAPNVMVERDFTAMCPPDCSIHVTRADIDLATPLSDQLSGMIDAGPQAANVLAKADVRAICFACTSASFVNGPGSDAQIARTMTRASGVPCITTSTAILRALSALGAKSVAVATPYVDWVINAETSFLESHDIKVRAISGMGFERGADINRVPLDQVVEAAIAIDRPDADVVFVSCTDLTGIQAIVDLEARLNKPVITSNQASFWALCRLAGAASPTGWGRLMTKGLL